MTGVQTCALPIFDFYYVKDLCEKICRILGLDNPALDMRMPSWEELQTDSRERLNPTIDRILDTPSGIQPSHPDAAPVPRHPVHVAGPDTHPHLVSSSRLAGGLSLPEEGQLLIKVGWVAPAVLQQFDIRQDVFFADLRWDRLVELASRRAVEFRELPRQLPVQRDLAMIVGKSLPFEKVEKTIRNVRLDKLREIKLFDIFESEKLGADKKSLAVSFTFLDEEKTLTDKEIDGMVGKIMGALEKELQAEIRK